MSFLSSTPFLKLCIILSIGILTALFFPIYISLFWIYIGFLIVFIFHLLTHNHRVLVSYHPYLVFIFVWLVGIYTCNLSEKKAKCAYQIPKNSLILAELIQTPKTSDKVVVSQAQILSFKNQGKWIPNSAKCSLTWSKDSLSKTLKHGDKIIFKIDLNEIRAQKNPYAFNYQKYLLFNGISHQAYLKTNNWILIKHNQTFQISTWISKLRMRLLDIYQTYNISNGELSVLSALTLGYKNELDVNIQRSYAASGAIHILAVSGLHVGIVFVIITYLLTFLKKTKTQRMIRLILTLLFIWLFALLTGGSPSVLRASTMFSFVAIGKYLQRTNTTYNAIFASAFILLMIQPYLLFNMSFQLSYAAVLSIVYFQPPIYQLIQSKFYILDKIWALASVSLAAQIGTFPICLYYFHQFPNYFLISNFIVIPIATIAIWLSLCFFLLSFCPLIAQILATILKNIIAFQNHLIESLETLPYALTENIFLDPYLLCLLLLSVGFLVFFLEFKKYQYILSILLIFITIGIYKSLTDWQHQHQKIIAVYDINKKTAINLINGQNHILITNLKHDSKQKQYLLKPYWLALDLNEEKELSLLNLNKHFFTSGSLKNQNLELFYKKYFFQFNDKHILFLNMDEQLENIARYKMKLDYLIVGGNVNTNLKQILSFFDVNEIIIDSSHPAKSIDYWKQQQAITNKHIHIVSLDGAYIRNV